MHEDPVTKSKRVTNSAGAVVSTIELDPWGADTRGAPQGPSERAMRKEEPNKEN